MAENQNNLATKINEQIDFYNAHNLIQPIFSKLDTEDRENIKEENKKLEGILGAVDNSKTHNPNNNQDNLNENYTNTETNNKEEKPGLLTRIGNKIKYLHTEAPWHIRALTYVTEAFTVGAVFSGCTESVTPPVTVQEDYVYLDVPYVHQTMGNWCLPAATKSVLNYYGMEITQKEIANYVIVGDVGGNILQLEENADKLGIEAYIRKMSLNEIKNEIKKGKPVIVVLDFSLENKANHHYVIDGFNEKEQEIRLMCPFRGFVYWSYDYIKEINDNLWIDEYEHESDVYFTALIWPKDKSIKDSKFYREKAIQIVGSQTDLFDKF